MIGATLIRWRGGADAFKAMLHAVSVTVTPVLAFYLLPLMKHRLQRRHALRQDAYAQRRAPGRPQGRAASSLTC